MSRGLTPASERDGGLSFAFGEHIKHVIRVVMTDDEPWFVLSDVCRALDIANVGNAAARLTASGAGVRQADIRSGGQIRALTVVDESGLYEVVIRSDKPEARKFRRWVTSEVLPAIRKTGSYAAHPAPTPATLPSKRELAQMVIEAEDRAEAEAERADKAEKQVDVEQRHRHAIEAGDGILLSDFGKKYFSEVRHTDFFEHLYAKKWLIDQRGTRVRPNGEVRNGHDHGKPTYKGRFFIYEHDDGTHGGKRRFRSRVRPQREIELRDALAAEGLPVNTHSSGLVQFDRAELEAP